MNGSTSTPHSEWRRSSYSSNNGGDCVEVARVVVGVVSVRDSKAVTGPVLEISPGAWTGFIRSAK
ncbi:DUF397 domain-containing protein [Streptomyces avicenniae]|uniref:DUF397 domain-containing protein n=1 Tax=Streptomyces avicenniae TaxID=500153 RepID=UPI000DA60C5E|nr:DUF397 domain-containing protein [Streptomyces avicenniae]